VNLTTDVELAEQFGMTLKQLNEKRMREHWPHVRLGRNNIRFTDEQIAEILVMQTRTRLKKPAAKVSGQTVRSASRGRAS